MFGKVWTEKGGKWCIESDFSWYLPRRWREEIEVSKLQAYVNSAASQVSTKQYKSQKNGKSKDHVYLRGYSTFKAEEGKVAVERSISGLCPSWKWL